MSEPEIQSEIVVTRVLPHTPEIVWRALTESSLIGLWLMENDFQPRVGHRFTFRSLPIEGMWNGVTDCEVIHIEPMQQLVYSWNASGEEAAGGLRSVVAWTLRPQGSDTFVLMEHSGFEDRDQVGRAMMAQGWPRILEKLDGIIGSTC